MIDHKVVNRKDLTHIKLNKTNGRYEANQLHLTLLNSTFAIKELIKKGLGRTFDSTHIMENHKESINLPNADAVSIEISTRFKYASDTGFYQSQYTIAL